MTVASDHRDSLPESFTSLYLGGFAIVLAGYALFGKGFAYVGIPPLYIGEISLFLGCLAVLASGRIGRAVGNGPGLALLPLMAWSLIRTAPYLAEYKWDAIRDSVIVFYGLFAFVIAALTIERPQRLLLLIRYYQRLLPWAALVLPALSLYVYIFPAPPFDPVWPSGQSLLQIKPTDALVHLTGIFLLLLLELGYIGFRTGCGLAAATVLNVPLSRGGMLALFSALTLAAVLLWQSRDARRRVVRLLIVGCTVAGALVTFRVDMSTGRSDRDVSAVTIAENALSVFGAGDSVDGTREWRTSWWDEIWDYTVRGPYFWTGKGFGINLADSDGFQVINDEEHKLRSPHSAFMTVLARTGVPGLTLFVLAMLSWAVSVGRSIAIARRYGDDGWHRLLVFLFCWWVCFLVNAAFDVAFEGPMNGIWFWTVHGLGIAAVVVYRQLRTTAGTQRP